jgi:AcrR family transcriptional regulator
MNTLGRRTTEQSVRTQQALLDATESMILSSGVYSLSARAIAKQVGVSHSLIRHYFNNIGGLVEALSGGVRLRLFELLDEIYIDFQQTSLLNPSSESLREKIKYTLLKEIELCQLVDALLLTPRVEVKHIVNDTLTELRGFIDSKAFQPPWCFIGDREEWVLYLVALIRGISCIGALSQMPQQRSFDVYLVDDNR